MAQTRFYGWKLMIALWAIMILNFAFPTFGTSVVNTYMAKAMHLSRKELGLAYSVFSLIAGLSAPLVAKSIYRFGIRFTLIVGALLASCGAFMMALFVHTVLQAIVVFGIVVGAGVGMAGAIGTQVGAARWFHKKRARAMSLLLTSSGIGGFIAVPSLNEIIARFGGNWRAAWWCMAVMSMAAALIAALFVKDSPAEMGQLPDGETAADVAASSAAPVVKASVFKTTEDWTLGEALSTPTVWLLIATYLGFFMGFFIYIAHGVSHLEGLGYTPSAAAKSISILMISSMIGQFAVGTLGDRIESRFISAVAVCLYGAGTLLAINAVGPVAMYSYAILMGTGFSAAFTCFQTILGNYYGTKVYPALLGVTMPIGTIFGAAGPVAAGYIYDRYHTYSYAFEGVAAICFASAVLYLFAKPPVRRIRAT